MTVAGPTTGPVRDEIVVDVADSPRILSALAAMGIDAAAAATIDALDIALVALGPIGAVRAMAGADEVAGALRAGSEREPSDLEVLMGLLRRGFAAGSGRMPRMGKNRDMQLMEGLPHTGGGEGMPEPAGPVGLARRTSVRGRGVRVGILDTAMFAHEALDGRYLSDDLVTAGDALRVWSGHASFVAGRVLRRAPGAELDVRRVLDEADGTASAWAVAETMASFLGSGAQVLNLSLGGFTADDQPPFLMVRAVERLGAEMILVAAAGNHGDDEMPEPATAGARHSGSALWPAALPGVVAVGAADVGLDGTAFTFSDADFTPVGSGWIDVWAPGVDVVSTYVDGPVEMPGSGPRTFAGYARWSGTSFAAADVTGEIAAIAQQDRIPPRDALHRILGRPSKGGEYDIRPA